VPQELRQELHSRTPTRPALTPSTCCARSCLRTATVEAVVSTLAMATGDQSSSVLAALARRDLLADALEVLRVEGSGRQGATNSNGSDEAGAG